MSFARKRRRRTMGALILSGLVLGGIATVGNGGASASSSSAAAEHSGAVAARIVPVEWDAYAVGPREASLELIVQHGVCGPIHAGATEGRDDVEVQIIEEQRAGVCPALATIGTLSVRLARPLAGRAVQGPGRELFPSGVAGLRLDSVPRLIGFDPQDAAHALALVALHGQTRAVHGVGGLRRVVAQYPAPGQRRPRSRVVRVTIAGH